MSHVDDGALHAYLDDGLDAYPAPEAARVREHLDRCAVCAERLDEARAVRDRAAAILGLVDPGGPAIPPFEEVRRRAAATSAAPARRLGRLGRTAWAASVVLALGTGWLLRDQAPRLADEAGRQVRPEAERLAPVASPAEEAEAPGRTANAAGAPPSGAPPSGAPSGESSPAEAPPAGAGASFAQDVVASAEPDAAETVEEERPGGATAERADVPPAPEVRPASLADESALSVAPAVAAAVAVGDSLGTRLARVAPPPAVRPLAEAARARGVQDTTRQEAAPRSERRSLAPPAVTTLSDAATARDLPGAGRSDDGPARGSDEPGSLVVPGLEVLSVSWVDLDGQAEAAVRVLQLLEEGDTLEVVHLPPGLDPSSLPARPGDDRRTLVAPGAEGWLVLRARVDAARLEALLARLVQR